jgi:hypothetical protein
MVADDELAMLYMLAALDMLSVKLLVLKFPRCSDARGLYDAILLGLGSAPALASLSFEIPILPGLENSFTLDFSFFIGLSGCGRCCGSYSVAGRPGDDPGDFGNTTLAAVCAAFPCDPPKSPF